MKKKLLLGVVIIISTVFQSCHTNLITKKSSSSEGNDIVGLASPILVADGKATIILEDYIDDVSKIKQFEASTAWQFTFHRENKTLDIVANSGQNTPKLSELVIQMKDNVTKYCILIKSTARKSVTLRLEDKKYKSVQVKGEMNQWNPTNGICTLKNGFWQADFALNTGNYQYLFIADGTEIKDPNAATASNGSGGFNSLLRIEKPNEELLPQLFTKSFTENNVTIGVINNIKNYFVLHDNHRIAATFNKQGELKFELPTEDKAKKRSFIRIFAENDEGLSNDILIPLENNKIVTDSKKLNRGDKETQIMYFALVDRFSNGNKKNDAPIKNEKLLERANWQGGDLSGIQKVIESGYLKDLNINALWISPITQNPADAWQEYPEPKRLYSGYHGYWPISSSKIDPHFGTDQEMFDMVKSAHKNEINILLDYVCHHVHENHPIYQNHKNWVTPINLPDGRKNLRIWDEHRLTTWFDTFLPTLNLTNPESIEVQADSTLFWLKKFDLDGYRHDATKHIPQEFWRRLTQRIKREVMLPTQKNIYQIGETYGSRDLIQSYIGSGMLDSQFDFSLYFDAREVFAKQNSSFLTVKNALRETFDYYGYHHTMGNITGNHDIARFISLASGAMKFEEDDRAAGFERDIQVKDPIGYRRLQMINAFNMTIPGVPVIYYGDEIGIPGANDPDNRRFMRFDSLNSYEAATKLVAQKVSKIRRDNLAMQYGECEVLAADEQMLIILRTYFGNSTLSVFNKNISVKFVNVTLPERLRNRKWVANFGSKNNFSDDVMTVNIAPVGFEIFTSNK